MSPASIDASRAITDLFGDPLRARIVTLLAAEELCTCHLVAETGAKQTTVSHHLRILREAGAVETEAQGRFTWYRLRPEVLAAVAAQVGRLAEAAGSASRTRVPCA